MNAILVELQPKRMIVRLHALTARKHREARDSLYAEFATVRWDSAAGGYALANAYEPRLTAWLGRQGVGVEWVPERPPSERISA